MLFHPTLWIHPVTPERWDDLEALFGPRGACAGCWCMWWRMKRSEFDHQKGEGNRMAMKEIVESGEVPGLLAYAQEKAEGGEELAPTLLPVGWCSVAPREAFPAIERSRILKRVDDQKVWSVVCFFVARSYRRQGLTVSLLEAAIEYARKNNARILEGYPEEPRQGKAPDAFVFTGLASAFRKAGFIEVARRSETRPIMRYTIKP